MSESCFSLRKRLFLLISLVLLIQVLFVLQAIAYSGLTSKPENTQLLEQPVQDVLSSPGGPNTAGVIWNVSGYGKKVALTFDDGPFLDFTPAYLEVLREQEVRATFF